MTPGFKLFTVKQVWSCIQIAFKVTCFQITQGTQSTEILRPWRQWNSWLFTDASAPTAALKNPCWTTVYKTYQSYWRNIYIFQHFAKFSFSIRAQTKQNVPLRSYSEKAWYFLHSFNRTRANNLENFVSSFLDALMIVDSWNFNEPWHFSPSSLLTKFMAVFDFFFKENKQKASMNPSILLRPQSCLGHPISAPQKENLPKWSVSTL